MATLSGFQAQVFGELSTAAVPGTSTISFTEIPVLDGERAVAFYSAVFGWEFHPEFAALPNPYPEETSAAKRAWAFSVGQRVLGALQEVDPEYAVTPAVELGSKKLAVRTSWNVDDIAEMTKKVLANGGKVHIDKSPVYGGKFGHWAHYIDTEGNMFGVWSLPE